MLESIIPMVVTTGMFAMIFGIVYIRSRENMAMIEKGLNPRQTKSSPKPFVSLKYGLLLIGVGFGLLLAYFIDINMHQRENPAIYFSLIGIGGGIGLVISYLVEKKHWLDKRMQD